MTISAKKIHPRTGDTQTIYLKNVITDPNIKIGDYTIYNDFVNDPRDFQQNNVLYHYPVNHDRLVIGKFCSMQSPRVCKKTCTYPIVYCLWREIQITLERGK